MEARIPARLSPAEGRRFGLTVGVAFLVLSAVLGLWRHRDLPAAVTGILGGVLVLAALVAPTRLGGVQHVWMTLAHLISKVTTPVFMGAVFFLVITPIGLLMRAVGRRPLVRHARDGSYWAPPVSGGRSDLTRQF